MPNRRRCLCLLAAVLVFLFNISPLQAQEASNTKIAVLPFQVSAGDDLAYLKDSLPGLIADRLRNAGFQVVDQAEVDRAAGEMGLEVLDLDKARQMAIMVNSNYAIYGSFTQLGDALNIESRLVDAYGMESAQALSAEADGIINLLPLVDDLVDRARKVLLKQEPIVAIDVEGTKILDKEVVLMRLGLNKGQIYEPKLVNDELKNIYNLGYFDDVKVETLDVTGGKRVVFKVVEKPRIQALGVLGADEIDEDDILEAVSTKKGAVLNLKVLRDDMNTIRALYRTEGYYKSKVDYKIEGGENGQARLNFVIEEGPKLYIKSIAFDGAEQLDPDDLRDELALSEGGFMSWFTSSDVLNEELLERDSAAIQAYYANRGFLNAKVGRPEVDFRDDGIYLTFRISEGPRVKIGEITYQGDLIADPKDFNDIIKIDAVREDEEYLNVTVVREDIETLTNYYNNAGYAYADIGVQFAQNENPEYVDVIYTLSKHQKVHIRRIVLEGNTKTRDNVILRELKLADGDQFSGEKLQTSIQNLNNLAYFEGVDIEPIPTGDPDEVDLKVRVKDGPTGQIGGGFGFSSSGGMYVAGSAQETNLFGKGYILGLSGTVGGSDNVFAGQFVDPRFNDHNWGYSINAHRSENEYDEYSINDLGGGINFLFPLGDHTQYKVGYIASIYEIYDVEPQAAKSIRDDEGDHFLSAMNHILSRSTLDRDSFFVSKGTAQTANFVYAGDFLGGTDNFVKYVYEVDHYESLFADLVFHARGNIGYIHENFSAEEIPTSQRFRLGGIDSVRGYSNRKISPRDDISGDTVGGNKQLFTNLELMYPLSKEYGVLGILFFDAGNAWKEGEMFFESRNLVSEEGDEPILGMYKSVGLGGKWNSPMGPLEIYWGYGIDELRDSSNNRLEFRMGQVF